MIVLRCLHNFNGEIDYTQYPIQKGLKLFKEAGAKAVTKEMEQLSCMDALDPKHPEELSQGDTQCALQYVMYLKCKRCGKNKARRCADGRSQ